MNRTLKKLLLIAGSTIPALAMFAGTASADVSAKSKVKNGDFSQGTTHWSKSSIPPLKYSAEFGYLWASNSANASYATLGTATQCVPVTSGYAYELSGKIHIVGGQKRSGSANMEIQFHSGPTCNGYQKSLMTAPVTQLNAWKLQKMQVTAPHGAKSALIRLRVHKNPTNWLQKSSDPFTALFDDVQLVSKLVIGPYIPIPGPMDNDPDPTPAPQDDPDPTPAPQDNPDPTPAPQDNPDPTPAPQDDPDPTPAPQDEPEDDGETVEEDAPDAPPVQDVPEEDGEDTSSDEPADNNGGASDGDDSSSDDGESQGTSSDDNSDDADVENNVETLGEAEKDTPTTKKESNKGGSPTPQAPEAGNASSEDEGLLGTTELAIAGAAAVALLGLAFIAGSRRGRKPEARELPFE